MIEIVPTEPNMNPQPRSLMETVGAGPIRSNGMNQDVVIEKLFHMLISGERDAARNLVNAVLEEDVTHEELTISVYWPLMEMVDTLFRNDQMTTLAHRYATKLLRSLVDQAQAGYQRKASRNRKICIFCGPSEV